ncbi:hypothetical protein [Lacticaseibacillus sp. N501-2]|uniref:hypothetical protein n=1 Tax=Lacticaseibacillus salsurae TaxID=3367729 RepID=UPI0038B3EF3C
MSALANLFARKQIAGTLTGVIPDVIKPELADAVATIKAETAPQTKVATGDQGIAIKTQVPSDAPHVDAATETTEAETEAK